ncbi:hypothetical protein [Arcanobacterium bovis]|uniref:Uncharacterized protein n=1 Tax=Arcanobacterium bovis TaxID=2529275 RepID=A0A4Q9UYV2_9ACTO|nr:hypothetical protein [Arcanobacterium bovis]TBW20777.1 hypothetical protein EZJ44_08310 [Arcanobacterium bovis]
MLSAQYELHNNEAVKIYQDHEAIHALKNLGIDSQVLIEAIQVAESRSQEVTSFYPKTAAGLERWLTTVGVTRTGLANMDTESWEYDDPKLKPLMRNKKRGIILSFAAGTADTGMTNGFPQVKRKQGKVAHALHGQSSEQPALDGIDELIRVLGNDSEDPTHGEVWVLLYHRDEHEIRAEVSLPVGISDGEFSGWKQRIILDPYVPNDVKARPLDIGGGDVDFEVIPFNE